MSQHFCSINLQDKVDSPPQQKIPSKKTSAYIPGAQTGKWTDQEHLKYIVFIDYNKKREREVRRSNMFFKEMSRFVQTRNSLQCRSHHQKLEEKYIQFIKIINFFKPHFDNDLYQETTQKLHLLTLQAPRISEAKDSSDSIVSNQVAIQTDIKGINVQFVIVNPQTVLMHPPAPPQPQLMFPQMPQMLQVPQMPYQHLASQQMPTEFQSVVPNFGPFAPFVANTYGWLGGWNPNNQ